MQFATLRTVTSDQYSSFTHPSPAFPWIVEENRDLGNTLGDAVLNIQYYVFPLQDDALV